MNGIKSTLWWTLGLVAIVVATILLGLAIGLWWILEQLDHFLLVLRDDIRVLFALEEKEDEHAVRRIQRPIDGDSQSSSQHVRGSR